MNFVTAEKGDAPCRRRSMVANSRIVGAALGSIMATIIMLHIANISAKYDDVQIVAGNIVSGIDMDVAPMPASNRR